MDVERGVSTQEMAPGVMLSPTTISKSAAGAPEEAKAFRRTKLFFLMVILFLGVGASTAFLVLGVLSTERDSEEKFNHDAEEFTHSVLNAWQSYEIFGLWIHEGCFKSFRRSTEITLEEDVAGHLGFCSRQEFRKMYEHIVSVGLEFQAAQFVYNFTDDVREAAEAEAKQYYQENYPEVEYNGFIEITEHSWGETERTPRPYAPSYLPIHYVEPVEGNEAVIDMDLLSIPSLGWANEKVLSTWKPVLSRRRRLVQETDRPAYGLILRHPGLPSPSEDRPVSFSQIVIRVPDLLASLTRGVNGRRSVYLYDSTSSSEASPPVFLGAVKVTPSEDGSAPILDSLPEVALDDIHKSRFFAREYPIADRFWTVAVASDEDKADLVFVILGGVLIFAATVIVAIWFQTHLMRVAEFNRIRSEAEAQKSTSLQDQALHLLLSEWLSHEIRNPLSSALSALSFVSAIVDDPSEKGQTLKSDIRIMHSSLQFINELLRNLLDVHRASSDRVAFQLRPTDLLREVLNPVASILYTREAKVNITVDCPNDLIVESDRMRLKQIVLNLASNSIKAVQEGPGGGVQDGYVRLVASVVDGSVELSVEDSGPGIPLSKRERVFGKFQESLDSLNEETGIGLPVCKHLSDLMGSDIWLDEEFESGVDGRPGTRFALRLNKPPLNLDVYSRHEVNLPACPSGVEDSMNADTAPMDAS